MIGPAARPAERGARAARPDAPVVARGSCTGRCVRRRLAGCGLREGRDAELLQRILPGVRSPAAERRALRGARREAGQPFGLHRSVLARCAHRRTEERRARSESSIRTGRGVFRRAAGTRAPALHPGERLPYLRASRSGRAGDRCGLPALRTCLRMSRRSASSSAYSAEPSAIRTRRTSRPPSWSGVCTMRSPMPDTEDMILNVFSFASSSACSPTIPGCSNRATSSSTSSRRAPARTVPISARGSSQLLEVLDTPENVRAATLDEDLARFPYVNGDLFKGHLRTFSFECGDAGRAAGRLPLRLVEHLARHLRRTVPVGDGPSGAPRPRGRTTRRRRTSSR